MIRFFVVSVLLLDDPVFAKKSIGRTSIGHARSQAASLKIAEVHLLGGLEQVTQPAPPVPTTCNGTWPQCHGLPWSKRTEFLVDHTERCHVGQIPWCKGGCQNVLNLETATWTDCQHRCRENGRYQSFWWYPGGRPTTSRKDNCECSEPTWDAITKLDRPYGTVSGTLDCEYPPNECYEGVEPHCWAYQITWTVQTTYQNCQQHCSALPSAQSFWWWPTGGGGCSCSSRTWIQCGKQHGRASGVISGDFSCTRTLPIPHAPCYNSYALVWESWYSNQGDLHLNGRRRRSRSSWGRRSRKRRRYSNQANIPSYEYEESPLGVQYGINIDLDTCFKICSEIHACIGIKWTEEKHCWLQSWAFYAEARPCGRFFVYRKEIANDYVPARETSCPCGRADCEEMTTCFADNLPTHEAAICQKTRRYEGTMWELEEWRHICDVALDFCAQRSPRCFTNMTLSWEQGLVQHIENTNRVGEDQESSSQLLLQRSDQTPVISPHAEVLRLPDEDRWAQFDADSDSKIGFDEFQAMLQDQGYIFPEQELYQLFIHADGDNDNKLCCVDNGQTGEWKAFYDHMAVVEFCPCQNKFVSGLFLLQASHMDKSGLEGDLDHAGLDMDRLGVDDDLDHVYKRKHCR